MNRYCHLCIILLALAFTLVPVAGCDDSTDLSVESSRGQRYCEILLFYLSWTELTAEVWGTVGLNLCPAASWDALDPGTIRKDYDATFVKMNGPRYGLPDAAPDVEWPQADLRTYGDVTMRLQATFSLGLAELSLMSLGYYYPRIVNRTTVWEYWAGSEIYVLTGPDASEYVMISYSQIVDPDLQESELSHLGGRLHLPNGWSFTARVLKEVLLLRADGEAVMVQDDLENSYQRR